MRNDADIHLMLGRLLEGQENLERGITGLNNRIDEEIKPVIDDYKNSKHVIIGGALAVSAVISAALGGIGKAIADVVK